MKIKRILGYFILFVLVISLNNKICFADTQNKEVTFIYISGILNAKPDSFENDAKSLHKHFANKKLGEYIISSECKVAHWGFLPREGCTYKLFQDGLIGINSDHNKSSCKKTYESKLELLINPFYMFSLLGDSGSSARAVYWRNYVHNHMYDVVWYFLNKTNREQVFSLIQDKINETDGSFVLVGNSFGAVIALDFIFNNVALSQNDAKFNKLNYEKFFGVITTADSNNTVLAPMWSNQFSPQEYDLKRMKFIKYFVDNNKFWISYNHRSDIIATGLAEPVISCNGDGNGFIVFKTNKASPLNNFIMGFKFWDRTNGLLQSHNWCFHKPKEFTSSIIEAYKQNSTCKNPIAARE